MVQISGLVTAAMDKPLPANFTAYGDAIRWIYDRINYERVRPRRSSTHFRLDRIQNLLALIGAPQERIPVVHIAGTKGKGSTAAMLDSILRQSGLRTGLFTSPHLERFEERMKVSGQMPDEREMTSLVEQLQERLTAADSEVLQDGPTYFEVATLLAWMYFDNHEAELVVLETGLGGRLDCTNVCLPQITVITSIGLDHTHILGDTLEKIAAEKAGILKHGIPVVSGVIQTEARDVIQRHAAERHCPLLQFEEDIHVQRLAPEVCSGTARRFQTLTVTTPWSTHQDCQLPLLGPHQLQNAALAVTAADFLAQNDSRITQTSIREGLANTQWPLRFEVFDQMPTLILDAAHNPGAIDALVRTLNEPEWQNRRRVLIFASSKDKDAEEMLRRLLGHFDHAILTCFETNPRSVKPQTLIRLAERLPGENSKVTDKCVTTTATNPAAALSVAREIAGSDGLVCVTGSIFLGAEIRSQLLAQEAVK